MDTYLFDKYSKPVLRIGMSLVFLYFGFQQVTNPGDWAGFVPRFVQGFGLSVNNIVMINGIMELTLGTFLIIGLYTRLSSLILSLHLFGIAFSIFSTSTDLGVRDFGLAIATLVVFFNGVDYYCIDNKFKRKEVNELVVEMKEENQSQIL